MVRFVTNADINVDTCVSLVMYRSPLSARDDPRHTGAETGTEQWGTLPGEAGGDDEARVG